MQHSNHGRPRVSALWRALGVAGAAVALLATPLAAADDVLIFAAASLTNAAFQHIGILSLEFHVDKLSRPLL